MITRLFLGKTPILWLLVCREIAHVLIFLLPVYTCGDRLVLTVSARMTKVSCSTRIQACHYPFELSQLNQEGYHSLNPARFNQPGLYWLEFNSV